MYNQKLFLEGNQYIIAIDLTYNIRNIKLITNNGTTAGLPKSNELSNAIQFEFFLFPIKYKYVRDLRIKSGNILILVKQVNYQRSAIVVVEEDEEAPMH